MKFLLSLTDAQPSFLTATPPRPSVLLDCWRAIGREMVEPVYVEVAVLRIGEIAILAMLPGRLALGVRFKRGRSVGGRGAGPGFMNCPEEYILHTVSDLSDERIDRAL
jgi:hypothetical protein